MFLQTYTQLFAVCDPRAFLSQKGGWVVMVFRMTDEELMQSYQQGNYKAFEELFRRYQAKVLGFLMLKTRNREKSEELFQNVFLKMHSARKSYDSALPFRPWLFTIARNEWVDDCRRQRVNPLAAVGLSSIEEMGATDQMSISDASPEEIDSLLKQLTQAERELVRLKIQEEWTYEALSKKMNIQEGTIRKRFSRVLAKLKKMAGTKKVEVNDETV